MRVLTLIKFVHIQQMLPSQWSVLLHITQYLCTT